MSLVQTERIKLILNQCGIACKKGMTEGQIKQAEEIFQIIFPPDYKELLSSVLPVSKSFYDWSDLSNINIEKIKKMLLWPITGTLFDVEHNDFWLKSWGEKPLGLGERLIVARENMLKVPKLIPLYSHRYISSFPAEENNPIYSVYQMDVIFYGANIWDYFEVEFMGKGHSKIDLGCIKKIPFWHDVIINLENLVESYSCMLLPDS